MAARPGDRRGLERDLGLVAVVTISLGGMIGGGIFVLPGQAAAAAGPAVPLAYLLAGLVVLPAALSKAELATAMPQSGGTYLFIDRAMGPLMGTIAGFGVWFSLVFKAAFALVGLGAYLQLLVDVPARPVAVVVAAALVVLNVMGTKESGRLQAVVVSTVVVVLIAFVVDGLRAVRPAAFDPLLPAGVDGLLAASGLVFVSYSGVTKVASIAEEIKDPGRTIPVGILSSIGFMALLYTAIAVVVVGVVPLGLLQATVTPIALAADRVVGPLGGRIIAVTAVLGLVSMANAGLLTSSRYPFAMSRDALLPSVFEHVHRRFATPAAAIGLTGAVLLVLVAVVPVVELAKLASAFQILVFALINVALVIFRHADMAWYRPRFRSPGYPWVQVAGVVAGVVLLGEMGAVPVAGAVALTVAGVALYRGYGRGRTVREGVTLDVFRRRADRRFLAVTERALQARTHRVAVVVRPGLDPLRLAAVHALAAELATSRHGVVHVLWPSGAPQGRDPIEARLPDVAAPVMVVEHRLREIDIRSAVARYVTDHQVDLLLVALPDDEHGRGPLVDDLPELMRSVACDVVVVRADRAPGSADHVVVMGAGGPFDELKVVLANRIAVGLDATIRFVHVVDAAASGRVAEAIRVYHARLANLTAVPTVSVVERARDPVARLCELAAESELVVVGATNAHPQADARFTPLVDRLLATTTTPLLIAHARASHRHSYLGRFLERRLYGPQVGGRGVR